MVWCPVIHVFTAREFAQHIANMAGIKKGNLSVVEEALTNFARTQVELAMEGLYLTEAQKQEWLRESEWSGI